MRICYVCKEPGGPNALRPYGEGGQDICYDCMMASPERQRIAEQNFAALLGVSDALGRGLSVIGSEDGPQPFDPQEPRDE